VPVCVFWILWIWGRLIVDLALLAV
jgi:hypothetical protein